MNILLASDVSPLVNGGAERMVQEYAKGLVRRGHQVDILFRMPVDCGAVPREWNGCRLHAYPVSRRGNMRFLLSTLTNARSALRAAWSASRPQVVNLHQPFTGLALLFQQRKQRVPLVYSFQSPAPAEYLTQTYLGQGNGPSPVPGWWHQKVVAKAMSGVEGAVLQRSEGIIVMSDHMKNQMHRWHAGTEKKRVRRIPGGVDVDRFSPSGERLALRASFGLPTTKKAVLTLRHLVPRTGVENLLRATAEMVRLRQDFLLLIAGEGPLLGRVRSLVGELALTGYVRLLGVIDEERLPDLYRTADLYVQPDTELQGFGLPVIEALACGTPVLANRTGGVCEVLEALGKEHLFSSAEPRIMAREMHRALDDREMQTNGVRYHRFAKEGFSWDRIVDQVEAFLQEICEGHGEGGGGTAAVAAAPGSR